MACSRCGFAFRPLNSKVIVHSISEAMFSVVMGRFSASCRHFPRQSNLPWEQFHKKDFIANRECVDQIKRPNRPTSFLANQSEFTLSLSRMINFKFYFPLQTHQKLYNITQCEEPGFS